MADRSMHLAREAVRALFQVSDGFFPNHYPSAAWLRSAVQAIRMGRFEIAQSELRQLAGALDRQGLNGEPLGLLADVVRERVPLQLVQRFAARSEAADFSEYLERAIAALGQEAPRAA